MLIIIILMRIVESVVFVGLGYDLRDCFVLKLYVFYSNLVKEVLLLIIFIREEIVVL